MNSAAKKRLSTAPGNIKNTGTKSVLYLAEEHLARGVCFKDAAGNALLQQAGIIDEFTGWGEFIRFVFRHPLDVAGIALMRYITNLITSHIPANI